MTLMLLSAALDTTASGTLLCLYPPDGKWYPANVIRHEKGQDLL